MNGGFEFSSQRASVVQRDASDENTLLSFEKFGRNFEDLLGSFACAEDDFGESFAQGTMGIHLRKTEVCHGRGLESLEDLLARNSARAKLFQESDSFHRSHGGRMAKLSPAVTPENIQAPAWWWWWESRPRFWNRYQTITILTQRMIRRVIGWPERPVSWVCRCNSS